ncbi:SH3 domain-containing protein [Helicobacter cinaedi]|uniref:SH3 domain protein n=1 Tax=Helicobacter cinaedi CCUG 18818 = ATCC BAA-847 TaxID=537971 RepID=A0AAI8QI53_9HELI|nr:SH3 domain-containing protein [Helicobacter cinaedi]EFR46103.1 SH3 domain protein [Helicobacter cinaedi CCUG 18818 = ATCC BAA-847]QOQ90654.1 SH3 domain-containing protein [Helicobacter cinaedi]BAM33464.1 hypothetical protein HCBAA847_2249 [Helicobacter cinaedi CCUG 18818 = ATCC BAA-847]
MDTRKFFKLYSLPFLIVALGIGVYVAVIMLMDQKNLIISKRSPNGSHIVKNDPLNAPQESVQIAQNEPNKEVDSTMEPLIEDPAPALPTTEIESAPQVVESQETNPQAVVDTQATTPPEQELPSQVPSSQLPPSQASSQKYGYAKYRINIRQTPSSESAIISRVAVGEALEILSDEQDGWSKVKSRFGVEGYVASRLLTQNLGLQNGEPYVVVANALNVRSKADSQGAVIGRLSHNMRIYVLETQGEWAKIQLPNKQYGYISLNHISKSVR